MGILVVGSVAFDSVKTPFGSEEEILGGSATYFSIAASYFTSVSIIAVVGEDFPEEHMAFLRSKGIDTSGIQRQEGSTFRWKGVYETDMNTAKTLETKLNVFADFSPKILEQHQTPGLLFLGNIDPVLQRQVLQQVKRPKLVACDTMNYWINNRREELYSTLQLVDVLIINDAETRQLGEEANLIKAARRILTWGPSTLVIKRGEYGALMLSHKSVFAAPAFPLENVVDPTGAGDSFAGGFMGYLSAKGSSDQDTLREAVVYGSVMASFNVCGFGTKKLADLTFPEIESRFEEYRELTRLGGVSAESADESPLL